MYNIANTILGAVAIGASIPHLEGGWLFIALLILGGVYIGHAITEALNNRED